MGKKEKREKKKRYLESSIFLEDSLRLVFVFSNSSFKFFDFSCWWGCEDNKMKKRKR